MSSVISSSTASYGKSSCSFLPTPATTWLVVVFEKLDSVLVRATLATNFLR